MHAFVFSVSNTKYHILCSGKGPSQRGGRLALAQVLNQFWPHVQCQKFASWTRLLRSKFGSGPKLAMEVEVLPIARHNLPGLRALDSKTPPLRDNTITDNFSRDQCLGRFWAKSVKILSDSKSNRLHVDIFRFCFH